MCVPANYPANQSIGGLPFYGAVTLRRERTRAGRNALATDATSPPPVNI